LRGLQERDDHWRIGALATWSDIISADLPASFDGLKLAAAEVGGVQIQNRGTLVGNICNASPAADGVPPLLALEAGVEISSQSGIRQMPLSGFIDAYRHILLGKDEIVTAILIPKLPENTHSHFLKLGARRYLVISIVMASGVIVLDDQGLIAQARIALGACSPVALRLTRLEEDLKGRALDVSLGEVPILAHLQDISPIEDIRASADYRFHTALKLLRELLQQLGTSKRARIA
jgi:CO/xanthine dehydrogenase FAD-binding subunit